MALFCIPKHLVDKLKSSAIRGEVDVRKLYSMSSQERRAFFTKHTDAELGTFINTRFEEAMISRQKGAMLDWAKSVFTPKAQEAPAFKSVLDKINTLNEYGVLTPKTEQAFLEDLVAEKLGVRVTPEEVQKISDMATKIQAAQKELGEDLGSPLKAEETLAFFKAKKELDDFLLAVSPAPNLRIATGTIGRGMMLASIKSPILNIGSNIEIGLTEAFTRRISSGKVVGADNRLALDYMRMVRKVYKETGYDISRMRHLRDTGASGGRVLGEDVVHSEGEGPVRKVGKVVETIVFKWMMGAPDTAFASAHFADSANLNALNVAKGDRAAAREVMLDAMRITPQTAEGEILRNQAILDAEYATWTNNSTFARFSEDVRASLNRASGNARVGDWVLPFIKTPSNVISTGMIYAGGGYFKSLVKLHDAVKTGTLGEKATIQAITRDVSRAGLGQIAALIIASMLDEDDFVGAYDPRGKQIEGLRNSRENSVRIGGKWISLDWFGPISVPLTAMLYARTYTDDPRRKGFYYVMGMGSALAELPPIDWAVETVRAYIYNKDKPFEELSDELKDTVIMEASSRLLPSVLRDLAKVVDPSQRETRGLSAFKRIAASIPFVSSTLPEKKTIFGETVLGEPAWTDILFGARVRTDRETPLVAELNRISKSVGKPISFTDFATSSSKKLLQFRETVGSEKYEEARVKYGQLLRSMVELEMAKPKFASMSDEEKHTLIIGLDTKAIDKIFQQYGFKYRTPKK